MPDYHVTTRDEDEMIGELLMIEEGLSPAELKFVEDMSSNQEHANSVGHSLSISDK